jgi:hypothetical protein
MNVRFSIETIAKAASLIPLEVLSVRGHRRIV